VVAGNANREIAKLRVLGRPGSKDVRFLAHLPSGATAYPFLAAYSEGTRIQLLAIVPKNKEGREISFALADDSCGDVQSFKVKPTSPPRRAPTTPRR